MHFSCKTIRMFTYCGRDFVPVRYERLKPCTKHWSRGSTKFIQQWKNITTEA